MVQFNSDGRHGICAHRLIKISHQQVTLADFLLVLHAVQYRLITLFIIWLTDFACCDWSIPGP